jgi:cytochrome c553
MHYRALILATLAGTLAATLVSAQHQHEGHPTATPAPAGTSPTRISMEQLHQAGGVPPGWKFAWPDGDAAKGRAVFARLECYQCHEVKGESFPAVSADPKRHGPPLAGMGSHHPAEYFAESIINPNAVIVTGPGFTGPDGLSIMPDYRDSLTLAETIDLVAYLRSLRGDEGHSHHPK